MVGLQLRLSTSPHITDPKSSTSRIMMLVVIALMPTVIASAFIFGLKALMIWALCVMVCVASEHLFCLAIKRPSTIGDGSAVVTGLLFATMLPVDISLYALILGCVAAIVLVKMVFGGIGFNFANPAVAARIMMVVAFPAEFAVYGVRSVFAGDTKLDPWSISGMIDTTSGATPIALAKAGTPVDYLTLFLGTHAGCIGETCVATLLLGAVFLLVMGVIDFWIPVSFMGAVMIFTAIAGHDPLFELLSGGLVVGACFMATDYTTSPITAKGKLIFGLGCGLITSVVRIAGFSIEAVAFSILFMNLLTPFIDRVCLTKPVGGVKRFGSE